MKVEKLFTDLEEIMIIKTTDYHFNAKAEKNLAFIFVSDLHCCDNDPIIEAIMGYQPDAVLVGGDFIHNAALYKQGFEFLRRSSSAFPTICCLGNHEWRFKGDVKHAIRETGAILLDDSHLNFHGIAIGGLTSAYSKKKKIPNVEWLEEFSNIDSYKILLCHHPEYYDRYIKGMDIDLILSGHAHGGQWRFFGRGILAPGQGIFPKYTGGLYDGRLLVSRGLGNPHVIPRINNDPEIVCIQI